MMIQPIGSIYAETYYAFRDFYPYLRDPPSLVAPLARKQDAATDIVDISPQAQAMLAKSTKNHKPIIA